MGGNSPLTEGLDLETPFGELKASFRQRLIWQLCDWRVLPARWRQKLRKRYARKVRGPFDVTLQGMNYRLYPAENYCDRVIFGRGELPEPVEHQAIASLVKPGMVFVDIGANVGSYSIFTGTLAHGDLILVAFEPHPRTFQKLISNLRFNDLPTDNVHNCGISGERDTLQLWSDKGSNIGHTSMLKEGTSNAKISVDVPVVPLLEVLRKAKIANVDLLKIDIEGFEDRALAPFLKEAHSSLLPKHILIETSHADLWETDLMSMFDELGYSVKFETAENQLLMRSG